uniref:RRM domain-containing protein n=2 Tax=Scylla olivacea TaxID=85551 RepID=A0A0P4VY95_SCYOL
MLHEHFCLVHQQHTSLATSKANIPNSQTKLHKMEQIPEIKEFHKGRRHADRKKRMEKTGDVFELGKTSSLPGMYLLSSDTVVLPSSGTKNPVAQKQDSKWHVKTPELKERILQQSSQLSRNSLCTDKFMKSRTDAGASQPNYSNDYDLFPPLSTQTKVFKQERNPVKANHYMIQHEANKKSWKDEQENNPERTIELPSSLESECKASHFWCIRREKAFSAQTGDKKEDIAFLHERSEADVHLKSNMRNKQANEHVKMSSISFSADLSISSRQKTESSRDSTLTDEEDINVVPSHNRLSSGHFFGFQESHLKKELKQNTCASANDDVGVQELGKLPEVKLYHSGNSCHKNDTSHQSYNFIKSNLDKAEASSGSDYTQILDDSIEEDLFCSSKTQIISYLKMLLKSRELQSPPGNDDAAEPKCQLLPECPATDKFGSKSVTVDDGIISKTEENLSHEDYSVWEEMLNNYIVISNLPLGVSKEEIFYHMNKVGSVSYIIMEKNRAHVIFFKAEDADVAFGLKHVLFGRELVVYRPRRPTCTLHLSGLTNSTPNEDVIKLVSSYGVVIGFYRPINKLTSSPMGYCFIKVDKQVAENVLKQNSLIVNNVRIFAEVSSQSEVKFSSQINSAQQPSSVLVPLHFQGSNDEYKVMLNNVPKLASYDLIKEHFQKFGKLHKVYVKNRKGFLIFASKDSLEQALSSRHTILGTEVKLSQDSWVP